MICISYVSYTVTFGSCISFEAQPSREGVCVDACSHLNQSNLRQSREYLSHNLYGNLAIFPPTIISNKYRISTTTLSFTPLARYSSIKGFPGKFESSNVSRDNVCREIGRSLEVSCARSWRARRLTRWQAIWGFLLCLRKEIIL